MSEPVLKVGDTVWVLDENHRVYPKGSGLSAVPIYREHFRPRKITGETSRSWLVQYGLKINKKTLDGIYINEQAIDLQCWAHDYKYEFTRWLERELSPAQLKALAEQVGFTPKERKP